MCVSLYILALYVLGNMWWSLFIITSVTKVHGLDNQQWILFLRFRSPKATGLFRYVWKKSLFWNITSYIKAMPLLYSLCHVTYITFFKPSDLKNLVASLQIYDSWPYEQDSSKNVRYPSVANIFSYFHLNGTYQKWLLNVGSQARRDPFRTHCIHECSGYGMDHACITEDGWE